jgi:hypothetical protein
MSTHEEFTDRPDFMKALGLLPPYSVADVEQAYAEKLARLPTDGNEAEPTREALQSAYGSALDFARFRESRRNWMGGHIERYSVRQATINRIVDLGDSYVLQDADRYLWAYGQDFAEIMRQLVKVELSGPGVSDADLDCLADERLGTEIVVLVLRDSAITDAGLSRIRHLKKLRCLDLLNTRVSNKSFETLCSLSHLEWLQLRGTRVGFWSRRRLRSRMPRLEIAEDEQSTAPAVYEAAYEYAQLTERIAALQ